MSVGYICIRTVCHTIFNNRVSVSRLNKSDKDFARDTILDRANGARTANATKQGKQFVHVWVFFTVR